jgi:hypothetical protein
VATVKLDLKITQVITNATGTVSFHDLTANPTDPPADANPANDKALVVINPSTGGTGGGLPSPPPAPVSSRSAARSCCSPVRGCT